MFTPEELERLPLDIVMLFSSLEERIMKDVVKKLKKTGSISRSIDYELNRLVYLGMSSDMIKEEIRKVLKATKKQIDKIYDEAMKESYIRDMALYEVAGVGFVPYSKNRDLLNLTDTIKRQTNEEFVNITNSMGFSVVRNGKRAFLPIAEYYQRTLDKAAIDIATGSFDYNTVLTRTVREMTNSGIRTVDFSSGRTDRIEVAARRAVMTGVNQLSAFRTQQIMEELGTDLVEVSWHATARPTHQVWQGRVYRWKEFGGNIQPEEANGLGASSGTSDIPEHKPYDIIGSVDFNDEDAVKSLLEAYEKDAVKSEIETACVIAKDGTVYMCYGISNRVFPDADLGDKLIGAKVSHNHPIDETVYTFSSVDYKLFDNYQLEYLRGCDEKYTYEFTRDPSQLDEYPDDWRSEENFEHANIIRYVEQLNIGYRRWRNEKG